MTDASTDTTRVPRLAVVVAALGVVLAATILAADLRERRALPAAAPELRSAIVAAAGLLSCLEGVQDDLTSLDEDVPAPTDLQLSVASDRLAGCDPDGLADAVAALRLPPPAPLTDPADRDLREDLESAAAALQRAVLDARSARTAMAAAIDEGQAGSPEFNVAFRAVQQGYEVARELLVAVEAAVRPSP